MKLRIHSACMLQSDIVKGSFFEAGGNKQPLLIAPTAWKNSLRYFDFFEVPLSDEIPSWFERPLTGSPDWPSTQHWWLQNKSICDLGDIKEIWDLSRFNWALAKAQRVSLGDRLELDSLNNWLLNWVDENPPYLGPNWVCGQEASIRVIHLAVVAVILGQERSPSLPLISFLKAHLARIASTIEYAISQDNNHGILESSGLFIGGEWLYNTTGDKEAIKWAKIGRSWLEERMGRIVLADGSFSMYSVSYHREFLDALSISEYWRTRFNLPDFSLQLQDRAKAATLWLKAFTHTTSGDAPNLGANDGSRLIPLANTDYRDFRPSVQLASALFLKARAYENEGEWNSPLRWLGIPFENTHILQKESSILFDDSGFAILRRHNIMVVVRYPRFHFRPSQADALHLDLWVGEINLLRDAGTYSYNHDPKWLNYFGGTSSHNTVQFDGRDQMPRLTRFLFGEWLKTSKVTPLIESENHTSFSASYYDSSKSSHLRSVVLSDRNLIVEDEVSGFKNSAILRWRLAPGTWQLNGSTITNGEHVLTVQASVNIIRCELTQGWESRHYFEKNLVPVLEVEIDKPGIFKTDYRWLT